MLLPQCNKFHNFHPTSFYIIDLAKSCDDLPLVNLFGDTLVESDQVTTLDDDLVSIVQNADKQIEEDTHMSETTATKDNSLSEFHCLDSTNLQEHQENFDIDIEVGQTKNVTRDD